jgi:hypothetical protein
MTHTYIYAWSGGGIYEQCQHVQNLEDITKLVYVRELAMWQEADHLGLLLLTLTSLLFWGLLRCVILHLFRMFMPHKAPPMPLQKPPTAATPLIFRYRD